MRKFFGLLGLLMLLGTPAFCASIVIENYTPQELKNSLVKLYTGCGASIEDASENSVVTNEKGTLWFDLTGNIVVNPFRKYQTKYNFAQLGNDTVLNAEMEEIREENYFTETRLHVKDDRVRYIIKSIKKILNGYNSYGIEGKKKRKYLAVTKVFNDTTDLKIGDKIYAIDNTPIKNMSNNEISDKLIPQSAGQEVKINFTRDQEDKETILKSIFIKPAIKKDNEQ